MGDSDDENFVIIGEALEPLDEDNLPRKKPVTIEDQYALDAQGRRRFHGAFTGGFSAGYFNSVGTRDGWRPHQFKSSRNKKAENVLQRPEDFMDEEDTGEFGIAPTGIRASSDFISHGGKGTKRERVRTDDNGPIPGTPVLKELLKPVTDTVGVKLLKKMGWKPGQGVGPRLSKNEKKKTCQRNIKKKVYGCSLPNMEMETFQQQSASSDDDDEMNAEILFAPDDFEPFRCNPKDNYFGIGYSGLSTLSVISGQIDLVNTSTFKIQDKNKKLSIRGQAFGVGAFEADDDDIYQRDDMSRYDFTLGPEIKKKNNRRFSETARESSLNRCVEGFVMAKNRLERKKLFPPPQLPDNYKPFHQIRKSRFSVEIVENKISNISNGKSQGRNNINARDREKILSDFSVSTNINGNQSSQSIEKLVGSESTSHASSSVVEPKPAECLQSESKNSVTKPSWMDKLTMKSFVSGGIEALSKDYSQNLTSCEEFKTKIQDNSNIIEDSAKPFVHDVEKQKRFDKFLQFLDKNEKEKLEHIQPLSMEKWERERELEEFEKVAKTFKQNEVPECKKDTPVDNLGSNDCAIDAAKMKMFGKLTRTVDIWRPASAVCKRFNISEPRSGCAQPETKETKKYRLFDSLDFSDSNDIKFQKAKSTSVTDDESNMTNKSSTSNSTTVENKMKLIDASNIGMTEEFANTSRNIGDSHNKILATAESTDAQYSESNITKNEKIKEEKENSSSDIQMNVNPETKSDLFKAIFLSSSESESENEAEDMNSETVKSLLIGKPANELNTQRNTSPARGIFAQLDLVDMFSKGESSQMKRESIDPKDSENLQLQSMEADVNTDCNPRDIKSNSDAEIPPDIYGPALPIKFVNTNNQSNSNQESVEKVIFKSVVVSKINKVEKTLKWVEKLKAKKSKKEKKKHKQKDKRKDRKHKHKSKKKKND